MAMRFRNFKHRCHLYYKKFSPEEARQHPPVNVEPLNWVPLCEHFESKKFKDQSNVNKENRKDLEVNHTSGFKSFIQCLYEMENSEVPPESSQLKLYKDTHQKKDGTWIDSRAEELHGKMEALKNQQTQEGNNNLTDDQIREEVGSKIGYALCLGHGVKPCTSNSLRVSVRFQAQRAEEVERRAEEVERRAEEAERQAEEAERQAQQCHEEVQAQQSKITNLEDSQLNLQQAVQTLTARFDARSI